MLTWLDTTVLVAGLVAAHPDHDVCRIHLTQAGAVPGSYRCTTHALAETFRVLVALPLKPRIDPTAALIAIRTSLMTRLNPLSLTLADYEQAFDLVVASTLGAAAVYDALHLVGAERMGAQRFLTANSRHFSVLAQTAHAQVNIARPHDVNVP
jgi:predicted nucleic acid-binding protein